MKPVSISRIILALVLWAAVPGCDGSTSEPSAAPTSWSKFPTNPGGNTGPIGPEGSDPGLPSQEEPVVPDEPLPGADPIGPEGSDLGISSAPAACLDPTQTAAYAPGPALTLRVCAKSYLCPTGHGLAKAQLGEDLKAANAFYAAAGSGLTLELAYAEVVTGGQPQADPLGEAQIQALLLELRTWADIVLPGHCDVVVGYINSMTFDNGARVGGIASAVDTGWNAALVTTLNTSQIPGESAAHELGHLIGLDHTHKPGGDGCEDTGFDPGCKATGCAATCPGSAAPPASNLMSYYHCAKPTSLSLTPCQVRRARCFVEHLFDTQAPCPVPVLTYPDDGKTGTVGDALTLHWSLGHPETPHTLRVTGPSGGLAYETKTGITKSATVPAGTLSTAGTYTWTVSYAASCCEGGLCESVPRSFTLHQGNCSGAGTQACGSCGSQTRDCLPNGSWGPWGPCEAQGECAPGTSKTCGGGDTVSCTSACTWPTCSECACSQGACCDGCHFKSATTVCQVDATTAYGCPSGSVCGGDVGVEARDRYCSGSTAGCDGELGPPKGWQTVAECSPSQTCLPGLPFCVDGLGCGCECTSGTCCDGCHYKAAGTVCKAGVSTEKGCPWGTGCGSQTGLRTKNQTCSGQSASCDGPLATSEWQISGTCGATEVCAPATGTCAASPQTCGGGGGGPVDPPCTPGLSVAPAYPTWTDPGGASTVRARFKIEGDYVVVELAKGNGGAFTSAGTLKVLDELDYVLAKTAYSVGATLVTAKFNAKTTLLPYVEKGTLWVMAEAQGGTCPGDASQKCYTALDKTGQSACGGSACVTETTCE